MIVAGVGCRKGVTVSEVLAAIETALEAHGLAVTALSALATTAFKRDEKAIFAAGRELGLPVIVIENTGATPISPSPLRGEVRGGGDEAPGGGRHARRAAGTSADFAKVPPPSIPPLKGEGGANVALHDRRGSDAPSPPVGTAPDTLSHSNLSQALAGTPSVSEAAALAVAGDNARLAGPRLAVGNVTCAIAFGGDNA